MPAEEALAPPFADSEKSAPPSGGKAVGKRASFRLLIYYWIFAASGFSGLVYESVWARYLKLFLGHAAYAQVAVLAIFLLGLAAGAALCARFSDRLQRPLLWYAAIEIVVGLLAVYFHDIYVFITESALVTSLLGYDAFKWTLAALLIFPQTVLLGATFPLMGAGLLRVWPEHKNSIIAHLYFSNSLGAALGALASGLLLVPLLGLPFSIALAGLISALVAGAVYLMRHLYDDSGDVIVAEAAAHEVHSPPRLILLTAMLTGLASFVYEIVWIRMLSLLLGSSAAVFEIVLAVFIFGLAIGSYVIRSFSARVTQPLKTLGFIQVAMGTLAVLSLFVYPLIYEILFELLQKIERSDTGYAIFLWWAAGLAMLTMLPSTICAGMTLPLMTRALMMSGGENAVGRVYAVNTLGSILGVAVAVYLLMPNIGVEKSIVAAAGIDIMLGVVLLLLTVRRWGIIGFPYTAALLSLTLLISPVDPRILAAGVFRHQADLPDVIFYRDGRTASISVSKITDDDNAVRTYIRTNGKTDAAIYYGDFDKSDKYTGDEITMVLSGLLPLLFKPDARNVMNIGFGSGLTSRTLLLSDTLERLDNIEIEPAMVEGARLLSERTQPVFTDARNHFILDDARSVMASASQQYDIIVSEPSNPWVSGVANLFTREFYGRVKAALTDDGIFVQWLQLYETNPQIVSSVAGALVAEFPHYHAFVSGNDLIFIASRSPLPPLSDAIYRNEKAAAFLQHYHLPSLAHIDPLFIGDASILPSYFDSFRAPINSDYQPYLEDKAAKAFFKKYLYDLRGVYFLPVPVLEVLGLERLTLEKPLLPPDVKHARLELRRQIDGAYKVYNSRHREDGEVKRMLTTVAALECPLAYAADTAVAEQYLVEISTLMLKMLPFLQGAHMKDVWEILAENSCIADLLREEKSVYAVYTQFWRALSVRDMPAVLRTTEVLLPGANLNDPSGRVLFLARLAANYAEGNYDALIVDVGALPPGTPAVSHAARMLAANAAAILEL